MRAKLTAVRTELILLGLTAVFLGVLWGVSTGEKMSTSFPVSFSAGSVVQN